MSQQQENHPLARGWELHETFRDTIPTTHSLRDERLKLAHGFRGFSLWSSGSRQEHHGGTCCTAELLGAWWLGCRVVHRARRKGPGVRCSTWGSTSVTHPIHRKCAPPLPWAAPKVTPSSSPVTGWRGSQSPARQPTLLLPPRSHFPQGSVSIVLSLDHVQLFILESLGTAWCPRSGTGTPCLSGCPSPAAAWWNLLVLNRAGLPRHPQLLQGSFCSA